MEGRRGDEMGKREGRWEKEEGEKVRGIRRKG